MAAVWGCPKRFSVHNNMELMKCDEETMRSLCGMYVVELGVGIAKGGES